MVTIDQAMRGIMRFADTEIIPHMPTGKGVFAGIVIALIMAGGKEQVLKLRDNPAVQMMHVMDDTGNIDLDRLYNIARPKMDGQKLPVTVPLLGEFKFDVNDLDKVYRYIQEA